MPNDVDALLKRYRKDFPEHVRDAKGKKDKEDNKDKKDKTGKTDSR